MALSLVFMVKSRPGIVKDSVSSTVFCIETLPPIDQKVPDTLPHSIHKQMQDSIANVRRLKNGMPVSAIRGIMFGVQQNIRCDTCTGLFNKDGGIREYLINLYGWTIDIAGYQCSITAYYVKDGKSHIRKFLPENGGNLYREMGAEVPFRFDADRNSIMIPVSKSTYEVARIVVVVGAVYFLYFLCGSAIKFLGEIARGTPFSDTNVRRLKILAINFFAFPFVLVLFDCLFGVIFRHYFTPDVKLDLPLWKYFGLPFAIGFVFLLLYIAFRKGKSLKEEQELTV